MYLFDTDIITNIFKKTTLSRIAGKISRNSPQSAAHILNHSLGIRLWSPQKRQTGLSHVKPAKYPPAGSKHSWL
jgi:hypothetical protein